MEENLPPSIVAKANAAKAKLIPQKSAAKYDNAFSHFKEWKRENHLTSSSEDTLMAFFEDMSEKYAPNTLWSMYSMIRSKLLQTENTDISKYASLKRFISVANQNYTPKKAKILSTQNIENFLNKAPDQHYLAIKVRNQKLNNFQLLSYFI